MRGELLSDLIEVRHEVLVADACGHCGEHMLVLDVDECEDLVDLEDDLHESAEIIVIEQLGIIKSKLLVVFLDRVCQQLLEHEKLVIIKSIEASDMLDELGVDGNEIVDPLSVVYFVLLEFVL